jgi:hypothetical protein
MTVTPPHHCALAERDTFCHFGVKARACAGGRGRTCGGRRDRPLTSSIALHCIAIAIARRTLWPGVRSGIDRARPRLFYSALLCALWWQKGFVAELLG